MLLQNNKNITKSQTLLLSFAQSGEGVSDAQISTDEQWLLFLAGSSSESQLLQKEIIYDIKEIMSHDIR